LYHTIDATLFHVGRRDFLLTRTRTTSSVGPTILAKRYQEHHSYGAYPGCSYNIVSDGSWTSDYQAYGFNKTMIDMVTPNYHKRMRAGEIINNPLSIITNSWQETPRQMVQRFGYDPTGSNCGSVVNVYGEYVTRSKLGHPESLSSYPDVPDINIEIMKNQAINQAYANVELSEAAILATLGELDETIKFIVSSGRRLLKIYRDIRKLRLKALAKQFSAKELADRYMEYRYAIRPLVMDVEMSLRALSNMDKDLKGQKLRQTFRSRFTDSDVNVQASEVAPFSTYWIGWNWSGQSHIDVTVSGGVLTDIEFISNLNIWGADQFIETVWELIPFSFIIDWFFNVGTTLAAWTPEAGVKTLTSWVTVDKTVTCTRKVDSAFGKGYYDHESVSDSGGSISLINREYTRIPNFSRSLLPNFHLNLDALKIVDLAIILKQLMA
jgi:hypothetical protein